MYVSDRHHRLWRQPVLTTFVATALHTAFNKVTVIADHHIKAPKGEIDADSAVPVFVGFVTRLRAKYPWLYIFTSG